MFLQRNNYVAVTEAGIKDFGSDSEFKDFWQQVNRKAAELNIDEPTLPRRRKAPKRFDQANATTHAYHTPEDFYRRQYLEVIDTLTGEIERDLDQSHLYYIPRWKSFCFLQPRENLPHLKIFRACCLSFR